MNEKKILIVDDTETNVENLMLLLEDSYELFAATDGIEALEILKEEKVDLILLDIMMPNMDGFEVCKHVKADMATADIPIIFITAKTDEDSIEKAYDVGGVDYIVKPFRAKEVLSRITTHLSLSEQKHHLEYLVEQKTQEVVDTQKELIFTMGVIVEKKSKETGNHIKRVAAYSEILALGCGLSYLEAKMLKEISPMHDIGKLAIADKILQKPAGFTPDEFELMKEHTTIGYKMLNKSTKELLKNASIVAYQHHEKYDGTGYPQGLKEKDIHIYGRITAVADVFDALGSDRVYKKAWDDEDIFKLFKEERGKHFDPKIVDIFFEKIDAILKIRDEFQDNY
jgi:putative two-component system response regulator